MYIPQNFQPLPFPILSNLGNQLLEVYHHFFGFQSQGAETHIYCLYFSLILESHNQIRYLLFTCMMEDIWNILHETIPLDSSKELA